MRLPPAQVERFYRIWKRLLLFVNRHRRLVPGMIPWTADHPGPWQIPDVRQIRDALWADDALRDQFIAENPDGLAAEDLEVVRSWRHRRAGQFFIVRQLKKYSLFVPEKDGPTVYAVLGLTSRLDDVLPFMPCLAAAVLLPWEGQIIYDSLLFPYHVTFGSGIRGSLHRQYLDTKERGAIVTSLTPSPGPSDPAATAARVRATTGKVLDAFRTHLFASRLSPRVVERDLAQAAAFAGFLLTRPEPLSLRDFGQDEVNQYLSATPSGNLTGTSAAVTSFKRLVRFLRDTERMDYGLAEDIWDDLRARKEKS